MAKRRKVWANWYPAVGAAPAHWGTRLGTKADACMAAQPCAEQVCLTERLPGDVVLSREDAKWLLSKALVTDFESADDRARTLTLLRGRR